MSANERPIVVAVPNDDDLESVVHYAAVEAKVHRCGVLLVHAHEAGDEGRAELVLARARSVARLLAGPSLRISTRRVTGPSVESVLAVSHGARAVVLRRRDSLNLMRVLASAVSGASDGPPVVCVPGDWNPWHRDPRPVLLAVDDPSDAAYAVERGLAIAHEHGTRLTVLLVWHLSGRDEELVGGRVGSVLERSLQDSLRAELDRVRQHGHVDDVPVDLQVVHGVAAELVVQAARGAQVLVLGRNAPGADGAVRLGRTARAALHESPCPTVVLAAPRPSPRRRPHAHRAGRRPEVPAYG